jgi:DNA gyrase/topoisomerase IV subunit B
MTTEQYQLYKPIQHILERPDMYVGSKQQEEIEDSKKENQRRCS